MLKWLEDLLFPPRKAEPGPWFMGYHSEWTRAHPGAWENGTGKCGAFCKGNIWVTGTPEWDRNWFKQNGMRPPRMQVQDLSAQPGTVRLANILKSGESVSLKIDVKKTP